MRISDWSSDVCSSDLHPLFPGGPIDNRAGNMLNVPVPAYTHGDELRRIVSDVWMPRLAEFRPEFIFISAGFDAHRDDDMGQLGMVESDYEWITRQIAVQADASAQGWMVSFLDRSEDNPPALRSLSRITYDDFCL